MDNLQEMLPPEIIQGNPMATMLITFMREAKKDIKRLPEPFILSLSQVIGDAFSWVAKGDLEEPPEIENDVEELLATL
jgi:hypothetical protein